MNIPVDACVAFGGPLLLCVAGFYEAWFQSGKRKPSAAAKSQSRVKKQPVKI